MSLKEEMMSSLEKSDILRHLGGVQRSKKISEKNAEEDLTENLPVEENSLIELDEVES